MDDATSEILDWDDGEPTGDRAPSGSQQNEYPDDRSDISLGGGDDDMQELQAYHSKTAPMATETTLIASGPSNAATSVSARAAKSPSKPTTITNINLPPRSQNQPTLLPPLVGAHGLPPKPMVATPGGSSFIRAAHAGTDASVMAAPARELIHSNSSSNSGSKSGDLPPDWEIRYPTRGARGEVYYYNTKTRESTWTRPSSPQKLTPSKRRGSMNSPPPENSRTRDRSSSRRAALPDLQPLVASLTYEERHYRPADSPPLSPPRTYPLEAEYRRNHSALHSKRSEYSDRDYRPSTNRDGRKKGDTPPPIRSDHGTWRETALPRESHSPPHWRAAPNLRRRSLSLPRDSSPPRGRLLRPVESVRHAEPRPLNDQRARHASPARSRSQPRRIYNSDDERQQPAMSPPPRRRSVSPRHGQANGRQPSITTAPRPSTPPPAASSRFPNSNPPRESTVPIRRPASPAPPSPKRPAEVYGDYRAEDGFDNEAKRRKTDDLVDSAGARRHPKNEASSSGSSGNFRDELEALPPQQHPGGESLQRKRPALPSQRERYVEAATAPIQRAQSTHVSLHAGVGPVRDASHSAFAQQARPPPSGPASRASRVSKFSPAAQPMDIDTAEPTRAPVPTIAAKNSHPTSRTYPYDVSLGAPTGPRAMVDSKAQSVAQHQMQQPPVVSYHVNSYVSQGPTRQHLPPRAPYQGKDMITAPGGPRSAPISNRRESGRMMLPPQSPDLHSTSDGRPSPTEIRNDSNGKVEPRYGPKIAVPPPTGPQSRPVSSAFRSSPIVGPPQQQARPPSRQNRAVQKLSGANDIPIGNRRSFASTGPPLLSSGDSYRPGNDHPPASRINIVPMQQESPDHNVHPALTQDSYARSAPSSRNDVVEGDRMIHPEPGTREIFRDSPSGRGSLPDRFSRADPLEPPLPSHPTWQHDRTESHFVHDRPRSPSRGQLHDRPQLNIREDRDSLDHVSYSRVQDVGDHFPAEFGNGSRQERVTHSTSSRERSLSPRRRLELPYIAHDSHEPPPSLTKDTQERRNSRSAREHEYRDYRATHLVAPRPESSFREPPSAGRSDVNYRRSDVVSPGPPLVPTPNDKEHTTAHSAYNERDGLPRDRDASDRDRTSSRQSDRSSNQRPPQASPYYHDVFPSRSEGPPYELLRESATHQDSRNEPEVRQAWAQDPYLSPTLKVHPDRTRNFQTPTTGYTGAAERPSFPPPHADSERHGSARSRRIEMREDDNRLTDRSAPLINSHRDEPPQYSGASGPRPHSLLERLSGSSRTIPRPDSANPWSEFPVSSPSLRERVEIIATLPPRPSDPESRRTTPDGQEGLHARVSDSEYMEGTGRGGRRRSRHPRQRRGRR